jgi:NTP pyrophosphatase (non-canonical NTP hydrolase)
MKGKGKAVGRLGSQAVGEGGEAVGIENGEGAMMCVRECMELIEQFDVNVLKWGKQDFVTLALAMMEEAGEVARAILEHKDGTGERERIRQEAIDLGALCLQVMALERSMGSEQAQDSKRGKK